MSRRGVYGTLAMLVGLLLALGFGVQQLLQRESGVQLLAAALSRFDPHLSIEHGAGTLAEARFARIRWEDEGLRVELRDIAWRLRPSCLYWGSVCFEQLTIGALEITLLEEDPDDAPFELDPLRPPIALRITDGRLTTLRVLDRDGERVRIDDIVLDGDWRGTHVDVARVQARLGDLQADASGAIDLRERLPLTVAGRVRWAKGPSIAVTTKGDLGQLAITASLREAFAIPIEGIEHTRLEAATLQATGTLARLELQLAADLESALLGGNRVEANGYWSPGQTALDELRLSGAAGEVEGSFTLQHATGVWQAAVELRDAGIAGWRPAVDLRLNGPVQARGALAGEAERLDAQLALTGAVNGLPAAIDGRVRLDAAQNLQLEDLLLHSGSNTLRLHGTAGEQLAVDGTLELGELGDTLRTAAGRGAGQLRIEGPRTAPVVRGQMQLERLALVGIHAGSAQLALEWHGAASSANALRLNLQQGHIGERRFTAAELRLDGSAAAHTLHATASSKTLALRLDCGGGRRDDGDWLGRCTTLDLGGTSADAIWRLQRPLALRHAAKDNSVTVAPFCLRHGEAALCSEQNARVARGQLGGIRLHATALPFAMLEDWLSPEMRVGGLLELVLEAERSAGGPIRATARLTAPLLSLEMPAAGESIPLEFHEVSATLAATGGTTRIEWQAGVGTSGSTRGSLTLQGSDADAPLNGSIELARIDLGPLLRETPGTLAATGTLDGLLELRGRLHDPGLDGHLRIHDGSLLHERLLQPLDHIELGLDFAGPAATIAGRIGTGAGEIAIDGEASWADAGWRAGIGLHSASLQLEPMQGSTITIAPDLRIELWPQRASITGTVGIPAASLEMDSLPQSAVRVSDDAVTLGTPATAPHFDYTLDVGIHLGEAVHFRGLGAETRLGGQLRLEKTAGNPLNGDGELEVLEGRYRAYGQRLEITEGKLLFRGPLDQPALRITAVRRIEDEPVTVGVRVRGDARAPELSVFSRPAMAEGRALHYLLTGRAPTADEDGGGAGAGAMMQLGLAGANRLTGGVMSKLGIEDFEMSSRQLADGQEVHLGGYLTPQLYLRYGVSTFDKVYTFRLRYRLRPQFFVEAISGIENAIDFLYSFER